MDTTMQIRVRVPARRMKKVKALFAEMGTDVTNAVNIFLAYVERNRRIPFDVAVDKVPNATTLAAIEELESGKGLSSDSWEEFMNALSRDEN
jgi:DNA-damage-inducible protein J